MPRCEDVPLRGLLADNVYQTVVGIEAELASVPDSRVVKRKGRLFFKGKNGLTELIHTRQIFAWRAQG